MAQTFKFIVKTPNQDATQYVLDAQKIGIGRHPDNEIQILIAEVSGMHAELNRSENGGYTISDLGSSNGTRVNGEKIPANEPTQLATGDNLLLGEEVGVDFLAAGATGAAPTAPRKKLALPQRKSTVKAASTSTPPSLPEVSPASPTVQIANPAVAVAGAKPVVAAGARTAKLSHEPTLKKPLVKQPEPASPKPALDPNAPDAEDGSVAIAVPRKLQPPAPKPVAAPAAEPEPAVEPAPAEKPRPALKLAKKKLAAPAPKATPEPEPEPVVEAAPEPEPEKKARPALKLAKKKLAAPKPAAVEAEPEPEIETAPEPEVSAAASLDQNSKGVTVIKKQEPSANPEATPVLRKKDIVEDETPPALTKNEQPSDVRLKKADPVKDDSPPKLVVPKKAD